MTTGRAPAAATTALGHRASEGDAGVVVECGGEARLAERERPQRDDDARRCGRRRCRHGVRMLPTVDARLLRGEGRLLAVVCGTGCAGRSRAREHIPASGPVILASNHVSYLDPLTLAYVADQRGRRVRFLAKAELFDKPGLGALLRAAHQIPVQRGRATPRTRSTAAVDALGRGECVAVFPEGTISADLEPMRGKSGTARLAKAAGVAVDPVGLWGTHRILTKGRKPHWQMGRRADRGGRRAGRPSNPTST